MLAIACFTAACCALLQQGKRGGLAIACLLLGAAAMLGVFRFSSWEPINELVRSTHQIASKFAAVGAFPVLAFSLAYPSNPFAQQFQKAGLLAMLTGGIGVAVCIWVFEPWSMLAPLLSALWMVASVAGWQPSRSRQRGALGLIFLFASFVVTLPIRLNDWFPLSITSTELFHYLMAIAIPIILWSTVKSRAAIARD